MEYKYENVENVEAKQDFEVYKHDEDGEVIGTLIIKKGTKGIVESMGFSSIDGFRPHYDILFTTDETEIEVGLYEDKMEDFLMLT
jgi:hypothetical protein